jgi:hypothetical protein
MSCPGSVNLARQVPVQDSGSNIFAQEGTNAHTLGELCLREKRSPDFYLGSQFYGFVVSEEMVEHVGTYVAHCRELALQVMAHSGGAVWIEHKFNLNSLNPPEPMFGTGDFCAYDAQTQTLYVVDLKYGQGVVVEVLGNKQTRYYALGCALSPEIKGLPITDVVMTIVQPRAGHADGPIRSETISFLELLEFASTLLFAAKKTQEPNAPLVPGSHCRFCPASGVCPAQRDQAMVLAQMDFGVETPSVPPAPETMPIEVVLDMLPKLHVLEDWIAAMRAHVRGKLERGEDVPGWKLVEKRAQRKWADTAAVEKYLAGKYDADAVYEPRDLKSVAQIEKVVGKKPFAASPLAALVVKQSSGLKMAPASDPSPAVVVTAGSEFLALPAGE